MTPPARWRISRPEPDQIHEGTRASSLLPAVVLPNIKALAKKPGLFVFGSDASRRFRTIEGKIMAIHMSLNKGRVPVKVWTREIVHTLKQVLCVKG